MRFSFLLLIFAGSPAFAQSMDGMAMPNDGAMPGMAMPQAPSPSAPMSGMTMSNMTMHGALGPYAMTREASGTSWQPQDAPMQGIMLMPDDWMIMLEGRALGVADSQSGPRGSSLIFAPGMLMAMASRPLDGDDTLGLHAMLSLDPFMGRRGYPLLLASGETADGVTPLVDRQHPHDLFMELAASLSHRLNGDDNLFVYVARRTGAGAYRLHASPVGGG